MLKMSRRERAEYEAMQRQENRERAIAKLRSVSSAATAALTDGPAPTFEPKRDYILKRRPRRKSKHV